MPEKVQKEKQTIASEEVGSLEEVLPASPSLATLPTLIGGFVTKVMQDPGTLNGCADELRMWYDAQPLENRKQLIADARKAIETAKLTTEWLFSQYQMIASKDM